MVISTPIRVLYRSIGDIIGKAIADRIRQDLNLDPDFEKRDIWAKSFIKVITELRQELAGDRDFEQLAAKLDILREGKSHESYIKLLAWILEAYLLLNQSSTACAQVTRPNALMPNRDFAAQFVADVDKELAQIFANDFSANLVLTAHPTAGIQPDYIHHIKSMVETIQELATRVAPEAWADFDGEQVEDLLEDLSIAVSHMVRAKPYNSDRLRPVDESRNFLDNLAEAWNIIPETVQAIERQLQKTQGGEFRLPANFFKVHSWVARDIDGNPAVSEEEHLSSVFQERIEFLTKYKIELNRLWQNLSDDFTDNPAYPSKTLFVDEDFKRFYDGLIEKYQEMITNPHQAYRVVIQFGILLKLETVLAQLLRTTEMNKEGVKLFKSFDVFEDIVRPLELIRANKSSNVRDHSTKQIDLLIRKAQVFGDFGSHGHSRQGADTLATLCKFLTALWERQVPNKTNYVVEFELPKKSAKPIKLFSDYKPTVNYGTLRQKITLQYSSESEKSQHKLLQTYDLLTLAELGGIKRLIISMNASFEDMLNALVIAKTMLAFTPAVRQQPPYSRLEIVPLTEQICDLRNSYRVTIDALTNTAWHQYLIAQQGRFIKMRGPSDSGKQNGFTASQWEMFRSKQLDTIVVKVFNAHLLYRLQGDKSQLDAWMQLTAGVEASSSEIKSELEVAVIAMNEFEEFFDYDPGTDLKRELILGNNFFQADLWKASGLTEVKMINFDGWGEPVERGGGLEFKDTVKCTQPLGSIAYYERTLQGGGAQQLASGLRTKQAVQDFLTGIAMIAQRQAEFTVAETGKLAKLYRRNFVLDEKFVNMMQTMVQSLRLSLRSEVFGLDLEDDTKVEDEATLRNYFRHVIKSPLVFLDLFNIASRPTSRSGAQLKEYLDQPDYLNDLDKLSGALPIEEVVKILGDVRAIPYAAMFSLLGGNHVSFYGFGKLMQDQNLMDQIKSYYQDSASQESQLLRHIIDSLEKGIISADQDCYRKAHAVIELATDANYQASEDKLLNKLYQAQQEVLNFVAAVKNYQVADAENVKLGELMQEQTDLRELLIARRNDAAVPRLGIAYAMSEILQHAKNQQLNPLDAEKLPENLLDLLRKAFAAGASTFGNGCID
ncbi:MAG: phosphoenolpyruvate carboxylase [Candidatus Melainabacteria bacterium]|nr:phosphoenolpyruvate carboxylase [Candidatus Melainabacteria bacterium]